MTTKYIPGRLQLNTIPAGSQKVDAERFTDISKLPRKPKPTQPADAAGTDVWDLTFGR